MKTSACDPPRGERGLTLLELLIVLALLGVGLAALGNAMRSSKAIDPLAAASESSINLLRLARVEAARSGDPVSVLIDTQAPALRSSGGRQVDLGDGVSLAARVAREATQGGRPGILFYPDGSSTGGRLTLTHDGNLTRIEVHWLTGAIHVTE